MPRSISAYLTVIALAFLILVPAHAQETPLVPDPDPADVESVDAIIAAVYEVISGEAGEERNWDRFLSLFHPQAKLIPSGCNPDTGQCGLNFITPAEYVERAGPVLMADGFFETERHRVEENYGSIAHVFSTYDSFYSKSDTEAFNAGINSFQIFNDGRRWWILNIHWQDQNSAGPIPEAYGGDLPVQKY